ncbi:MAG: hypothetical protein QOH30_307, partial [Baekduia sp.]|nr:hypothetical protein [Baekduia sp.]
AFGTALERFDATDDLPAMAGAHCDWAIFEERHGDPVRARELYAAGAALWAAQQLTRFEAWGNAGLAAVLARLGDAEGAASVGDRARAAFVTAGDALGVAEIDRSAGAKRAQSHPDLGSPRPSPTHPRGSP